MINVYLVYVRLNNEIFNLHEIKTTDISKNIKLYKFRMFIVIQLYYEILQTTSRYIIHLNILVVVNQQLMQIK